MSVRNSSKSSGMQIKACETNFHLQFQDEAHISNIYTKNKPQGKRPAVYLIQSVIL